MPMANLCAKDCNPAPSKGPVDRRQDFPPITGEDAHSTRAAIAGPEVTLHL